MSMINGSSERLLTTLTGSSVKESSDIGSAEKKEKNIILDHFWREYYSQLENQASTIKEPTNISTYQKDLFSMLKEKKSELLSEEQLRNLGVSCSGLPIRHSST